MWAGESRGRVGAWVRGCVGGVGPKFACVTWVAWVYKMLVWVKKMAWVAWIGVLVGVG